jgi:hypothetical protein
LSSAAISILLAAPEDTNLLIDNFVLIMGHTFVADVIREFLLLIGTQHCLTLAYSKEENAVVESMNKEINTRIDF